MLEWLRKITSVRYLLKAPTHKYVLLFLIPSIFLGHLSSFLPFPKETGMLDSGNPMLDILLSVIAGPLVETIIFQFAIIEIVFKVIKRPRKNIYVAVFLSAALFAWSHNFSVGYVMYAFLAGIILALTYYFGRYRKEGGILLTFVIHGASNFYAEIYNISISQLFPEVG